MSTRLARKFLAFTAAALCLAIAGVSQVRADYNDCRDRDAYRRQYVQRRDCSPRQRDCDVRDYRYSDSRWSQPRLDARIPRRGCDSNIRFWSARNWNSRNCR